MVARKTTFAITFSHIYRIQVIRPSGIIAVAYWISLIYDISRNYVNLIT